MNGRPHVQDILELLAAAGEAGMQAGDIARAFPDGGDRRIHWSNNHLNRMLADGRVTRSAATEPSTYYHGVPCRRWFITPAGLANLAGRSEVSARKAALAQVYAATRAERTALEAQRTVALVHAAQVRLTGCLVQRASAMRDMVALTMTYKEIGLVFGISYERVRQITKGAGRTVKNPRPCLCERCKAQRLSTYA